jgi:hypothetical protein
MGSTREFGLGAQVDREEQDRRRRDEKAAYDTAVMLNKWAFRTSCLKRHRAYTLPESSEGETDGDEGTDG